MKFKDVTRSCCYDIETEDGVSYQRWGSGVWNRRYGDSWEPEYSDEEILEALFKKWLQRKNDNPSARREGG